MSWFQRRNDQPKAELVTDPWNDAPFVCNEKPVTLRQIKYFAHDMAFKDARNPAEEGLALTILSLCGEIDRLHRGPAFRVEVACDGYAALMESDVPQDYDPESYIAGAAAAATDIRAALKEET